MSLPSNYTKLDYIESHGIEYFDTGFKPNQDTRVVMDCNLYSYSATGYIFGCRGNSSQNYANRYGILYNGSYRTDYGDGNGPSYSSSLTYGTRVTIDKNKRVCIIGSESLTNAESTFQSLYNMALFCAIEGGTPTLFTNVQLYSCKIYDNGTLVRDFIPAMNASGVIGLWDDVNSTFYTNAGTGTFGYHVSKKHKTLIGGTGYEAKGGRTLIGGTGYSIKKGRTLIGGTGYDISFGTPVGELDVGTSVYLDVDSVSTEFLVVHQGNPDSSKYDTSCDGTWILAKYVYALLAWANSNSTSYLPYNTSLVDTYAQDVFFNKLDDGIQGIIKQANLPVNPTKYSGSLTIARKIFVPRVAEVIDSDTYVEDYSAILDYFKNKNSSARIAYYQGNPKAYWLRNDAYDATSYSERRGYTITTDGVLNYEKITNSLGFRPMLILSSEEALYDSDFNIIAS